MKDHDDYDDDYEVSGYFGGWFNAAILAFPLCVSFVTKIFHDTRGVRCSLNDLKALI